MNNNNSNEYEKVGAYNLNKNSISQMNHSKTVSKENQGVICSSFEHLSIRYFQIFDVELGFLYTKEKDTSLTCATCSWVIYNYVEVENGIRGMKFLAENVFEIEGKESKNPASNEFKQNNQFDFNKKLSIDYFDFDTKKNMLLFKSWITYNQNSNGIGNFTNNYYGDVEVKNEDFEILRKHGFEKIEAIIELKSLEECQKSTKNWKLRNFMYDGKIYNLNGFLSITGKLLRGTGGHVLPRERINIQPDSLRPMYSPNYGIVPEYNKSPTTIDPSLFARDKKQIKNGRPKNKEFGLGAIFGNGNF